MAPFNFVITNRDATGSLFTDLQTRTLTNPQTLAPSNAQDLGFAFDDESPPGAGELLHCQRYHHHDQRVGRARRLHP